MGQTESRKLKRNKKSLVFPKTSSEFMETFPKTTSPVENKDKEGSVGKKHAQTKGVAMSFGFRKTVRRELPAVKKADEQLLLPRRTVIRKDSSSVENEETFLSRQDNDSVKTDANRFGFRVNKPHQETRAGSAGGTSFCYRSRTSHQPQVGKYTLQSTELPQLEPVRVIESKTEKTLINTRRKTANNRLQYREKAPDADFDTVTKSIKNNNDTIYAGREDLTTNKSYLSYHKDEICNNNVCDGVLTTSISNEHHSHAEKPVASQSPWKNENSFINPCNKDKTRTTAGSDSRPEPDIQKTFFKLKLDEISKCDNQSDLWDNAGEAMALDLTQLSFRSHKKTKSSQQSSPQSTAARLISPLRTITTLNPPDNDELSFVTVASAGVTGMLLDDEILSPIESLSSSESADANTKSSLSKDINEKSPDSTPPSPTNVSSMSLVEEKDFLIDDEIEDQPGLTFKNTAANEDESASLDGFKYEYDADSLRRHLLKSHAMAKAAETSPLSLKTRRLFPKSTGSLDSLSSCESIASDDFIMDYDSSHTNDVRDLHRPLMKPGEKATRLQDKFGKDSSWMEHDADYESRHVPDTDTLNYNLNNGFTLNLSVKQSPTIQKDVRDIKKLLVKLKMLLNDSDAQNPFRDVLMCQDGYPSAQGDNPDNANVMVERELADLRRQVLFLQVQLENKEETLASLQKQITDLSSVPNANRPRSDDASESRPTIRTHCNAATQTKRITA